MMEWKNMYEVFFTKREVQLLCEAIEASLAAAEENRKFEEASEWLRLRSKLACHVKEGTQ